MLGQHNWRPYRSKCNYETLTVFINLARCTLKYFSSSLPHSLTICKSTERAYFLVAKKNVTFEGSIGTCTLGAWKYLVWYSKIVTLYAQYSRSYISSNCRSQVTDVKTQISLVKHTFKFTHLCVVFYLQNLCFVVLS